MGVLIGGTEEEVGFFKDIKFGGVGNEWRGERGRRRFGEESDEPRGRVEVES